MDLRDAEEYAGTVLCGDDAHLEDIEHYFIYNADLYAEAYLG